MKTGSRFQETGGQAEKSRGNMSRMELLLTSEEYNVVDSIRGQEQDVHYAIILAKEINDDRWKIDGNTDLFRNLQNTIAEEINTGFYDADDEQTLESVYKKLRQLLKSGFTIE